MLQDWHCGFPSIGARWTGLQLTERLKRWRWVQVPRGHRRPSVVNSDAFSSAARGNVLFSAVQGTSAFTISLLPNLPSVVSSGTVKNHGAERKAAMSSWFTYVLKIVPNLFGPVGGFSSRHVLLSSPILFSFSHTIVRGEGTIS